MKLKYTWKGTTEDEIIGWHHQLSGQEFEQTLGDGEGQGSPACCNPLGRKVSDTTERPNNKNFIFHCFTQTFSEYSS